MAPESKVAGFRVVAPLGGSASADVLLVEREGGRGRAALKRLAADAASDLERRVRFEREAELLAQLSHPGIVRLLSRGVEHGRPWLLTELAPGRSLDALLAEQGAQPPVFTVAVLMQIAQALAHAHGQRILHGDIKPANIVVDLVDGEPVARLLDFGFGSRHKEAAAGPRDKVAGTFRYMAPEQWGLLASAPDQRSDLYALGIVALEMLAGRHPFDGLGLRDLIHAHAAVMPAMPPGMPPALAQIVSLLVRKDPADRYPGAASVAADLATLLHGLRAGEAGPFPLNTHEGPAALNAPRLFGRSAERQRLAEAYERARGGMQWFGVAGVSGMGKTRLIAEVSRGWARSIVLSARGRALGQTAAYGLMAEALRSLAAQPLAGTLPSALRDAVGAQGAELLALVPALRPLLGEPEAQVPVAAEHQQQRLFNVLGSLLDALGSADAPLVLLLDDLQWADEGSLQFLLHLARRGVVVPVLVVLAWREDEVAAGSRLARWLDAMRALQPVPLTALQPLQAAELRTLVQSMLGSELADLADAVAAHAQGHPLHAIELVRTMVERGALRRGAHGWEAEPGEVARLARGHDDLQATIAERLARLDGDERELLSIAAVGGRVISVEHVRQVLQATAGLDSEPAARRTLAALVAAEQAQLVVRSGQAGAYGFAHDKIREALYDALPPERRAGLHQRLAELLARPGDDAAVYEVAHHYRLAGDARRAMEAAARAGDLARRQYAHLEALAFFTQALSLAEQLPAPERDARLPGLRVAVADSQIAAGLLEPARQTCEQLLSQPGDPLALAETGRKLGLLLHLHGETDRAVQVFVEAIERLGERVPRGGWALARRLAAEGARRLWHELRPPRAMAAEDERLRIVGDLYVCLTTIFVYVDVAYALAVHLRHLNLMERHGAPAPLGMAHAAHGTLCGIASMFGRSRRFLGRAVALQREQGNRWTAAQTSCYLMLTLIMEARWDECLEHGRFVLAELEQQGSPVDLNVAMVFQGYALVMSGQWDEAEALLARQLRLARQQGAWNSGGWPINLRAELVARQDAQALLDDARAQYAGYAGTADQVALVAMRRAEGRALVKLGRYEEACEALADGASRVLRYKIRVLMMADVLLDHVELLQRLSTDDGPRDRRRARLAEAARALRRARLFLFRVPAVAPWLLRLRAKQAWLSGRRERAQALWRRALAAADEYRVLPQRAHGLADWGLAIRATEPQRAANLLAGAADIFETLGAEHPGLPPRARADRPPSLRGSSGLHGLQVLQAQRLQALVGIARRLSTTQGIDELLQAIVESAAQLMGAERGLLYLLEGGDSGARGPVCRTRFGTDEALAAPVSSSVIEQVLVSGRGVSMADAQSDPAFGDAASVLASGVRSILCVPLVHDGEVAGALYLDNRLVRGLFGESDLGLLQALAAQAAVSLHNVRLFGQLQGERHALEAKVAERTAELDLARQAAEAGARAKGEFLANMSHEIRTPMNAILGMAYLALRSGLTPRQEDYLRKLDRSAHLLLGLLNDILDLSKVEAGKLEMERVAFRLADVLEQLGSVAGLAAEAKGLQMVFDVAPDVPDRLVGDPLRLTQVLVNLGNNAVKFTERGGIVVSVRAAQGGGGEDRATLFFAIKDTGVGLSAEQRERLFHPFVQGDASVSRRHGGTGLGLAISRQLVSLMGGEIGCDSVPGQGSRFHFDACFGLSAGTVAQGFLPAGVASLAGVRVLAVLGHEPVRRSVEAALKSAGAEVLLAADAWDAMRASAHASAAGGGFDVVLLDDDLPAMAGTELLRRLARDVPLPPFVLLGPQVQEGLQERLAQSGLVPSALLARPVTPWALARAVSVAAGRGGDERGVPQAPAGGTLTHRLKGLRVLLVEDNDINRDLALEVEAGAETTAAVDGRDALRQMNARSFDLVLMDCQMPEMDGYEATRRIRAQPRWRALPVIAMTANAMAGDREQALAAGMNDYITKPIDVPALCAMLARWRPA